VRYGTNSLTIAYARVSDDTAH